WLKALSSEKALQHPNPEALLMRIAKHKHIDDLRRNTGLSRIIHEQKSTVRTTKENTGILEIEEVFQAMMKHWTPLQRSVFLLRDVLGYSCQETAEMLTTTEGAVKSALFRARQSLDVIRKDIDEGASSLAEEEILPVITHAMAIAYLEGDIPTLIRLAGRSNSASTSSLMMLAA